MKLEQRVSELEIELSLYKADRALGLYYKNKGVSDYFVEGSGKLQRFVDDQKCQLSEEVIELYTDPKFPFPSFISKYALNKGNKERIITGVVRYCCQHHVAPSDECMYILINY